IIAEMQNLIDLSGRNAALQNLFTSTNASDFVSIIRDSSVSLENTFTNSMKQVDEKMNAELDRRKKEMFDAVRAVSEPDLLKLFPEFKLDGKNSVAKAMDAFEKSQSQTEAAIINIQVHKEQANAAAGANLVDLNFPTQSDIIDAVGIYLAKRTKQEAALFFLETLVTALRTNQLAQDLFPNTWKVMQTMESYTTPRFGAQWRNAIANDFIELPQSIRSSAYIANKIPNKVLYDHFSDAVTFAGYVGKKYSFPDILRTLYSDHSLLRGRWTSIAVDALHIINTELRDIKSQEQSWIKPESFLQLDSSEAYCLFDLLRLQYQDEVSVPMRQLLGNTKEIRGQLPAYKRFFTEILTTLKQFHSIQKGAAADKAKDGTIMASDGFWDTQRNLLDFLLDQKIVRLSTKERQAINLCKSSFYIYDHLSNKNYIGAAEHVITIVSDLLNQNTAELIHLRPKAVAALQTTNAAAYYTIDTLNQRFSDLGTLQKLKQYVSRTGFSMLSAQNLRDSFDLKNTAFYQRLILNGNFDGRQLNAICSELRTTLITDYQRIKQSVGSIEKNQITYVFKDAAKLDTNMLNAASVLLSRENNKYFKWLADFAGLLTEISITKKSDELANVIESYALPPGSYRMKRNADFSIDLNAFTGFYVGAEYVKKLNQTGLVYG
ncbi:MAG TPA: hypothetical protein VGB71_03520, partial [Flavisolibacter sp.]